MRVVDTTMFFCDRGGGVKQYLLAKQAWFSRFASYIQHTLLVPGPLTGFSGVQTCNSPCIPLVDGYRFPVSIRHWRNALLELAPDLIEAGDPYVPGLAARESGQRLGVPVVAFFHSDVPRMMGDRFGPWAGAASRAYLQRLYKGFDLVLAPSHAMLEQLDAFGIRNTALQPLGVDTEVFTPALRDPTFRRAIGVSNDTRLLVYAGRFAREKNLPALIGAVEKLGGRYHLLLVGADRHARASRHVTVWPYEREPARLARVLASCDALVHAGDAETFGLIAIEAMACGLPVVAVGAGGIKELVNETVGVLVERPQIAQMAAAISALFERDPGSMGVAARGHVLRSYSWHIAFRQLVQTYAQITGHAVARWSLLAVPGR